MMEKTLPEVCIIQYGFPFDSSKFCSAEGVPLVRIRDVVRGYSETYTTEIAGENYIVNDGDLLIGMDGEFNIAYWKGGRAYLNQRVCRLIPREDVDRDYIFYYMPQALKAIEDATPFVTVKHLSAKQLSKILIPLPDMSEQQRISAVLRSVDRVIAMRKKELDELNNLVKSRFIELFAGVEAEDTLQNLCIFIDYRGKTPEKVESGLPFITAKNIRMHHMSFDTLEYISKETYDRVMTRGFPQIGDVVFTTEAPLGNVCRIPFIETEFYIGQRIITMQTERLEPAYLEYALSSDEFKRKIAEKSSGSTVTGIRSKLLEQLTIPVPPRAQQQQFAAFVEQTDKSKLAVQKGLQELEILKKSLMQQYFG